MILVCTLVVVFLVKLFLFEFVRLLCLLVLAFAMGCGFAILYYVAVVMLIALTWVVMFDLVGFAGVAFVGWFVY